MFVVVGVFNGESPVKRVDDLRLRLQRHDGNKGHQQAEKESFHIGKFIVCKHIYKGAKIIRITTCLRKK
jgi:hypothetical protein